MEKTKNDLDDPLYNPEPRDSHIIGPETVGVFRFRHVTELLAHANSESLLAILFSGIE